MARAPRFRVIMSILTKGKVWHTPLNNLLSHTKRYLKESHQNLVKSKNQGRKRKRQQEPETGRPKPRSVSHSHSIQSRLGLQYVQPKMARSSPTSHQTLNSRFESIKRPRMIRPLVTEAGRWVTLESPGLKSIYRQEYKYGYTPYFSRMT